MSTDQLTVLIPTHQRARYLDRLLRYLAAAGHRSRVLIADSSTDNLDLTKEAVARAADHFPCAYVKYPPKITWYRKTYEALLEVKTPIVMMLADDDFVIPSTLEAATARLAADPSISIAHGRAMSLSLDHGPGVDPMSTLRSRSRRHLVAEHERGIDRITHYLRNYSSIFYSVSRRELLTKNFKYMSDLNQDYDFGQTMCGCLCLAHGKAVAVDGLYYVVTDTAIGTSRRPSSLMVGWRRLITQPDFSQRYTSFKSIILDELDELDEASTRAEAEEALDAAFVDYLLDRIVNKRMGELDRLRHNARQARESLVRLGAVASRGLRSIAQRPAAVRDLKSPRQAFARWARALDPMSLDSLSESPDSAAMDRVITAIEGYPG